MIESSVFREAMSRLGAAVTVITTDGEAGRHGFTASAVCSVTDKPPTLLVCMNRSVSSHGAFLANRVLSVNVLSGGHQELSSRFTNRSISMADRFSTSSWTTSVTGAPLLTEAAVAFDCRLADIHELGTHSVLFCEILDIRFGTAVQDALVYCNRAYHRLPIDMASA